MSLRLPADVADHLAALSALTGQSKTFCATEAIVEHIDDLEDGVMPTTVVRLGSRRDVYRR
ncbi:MAG: hypothetical protein K2W81_12205 [Sphingomonas sp.]|uniref:hypothetical protein n=1 Tax=Sphingomonas sp. TaxID=28214 RepID=UPI0025D49CE2|nr:hypothetical protein [Sphingomonas sp.]MBY0284709.1 hypothetical protein [Sphingomonas sp.]